MKHTIKIVFYNLFLFVLMQQLYAQEQQVVTFISTRSQTNNNEKMLAGWENSIHQARAYEKYSTIAFSVEATSSFRPERINQCLFGEEIITCKKEETEWQDFIIISGSQTENRVPQKDWLADYFGLPTDFKSVVKFRPRVNNFIFDMQFFCGLNALKNGAYIRAQLPLVYANWDLNIKESVLEKGSNSYTPGYFNDTGINRSDLLSHFTRFMSGTRAPIGQDLIFESLRQAKMNPKSQRLVHFSDLLLVVGYDHFLNEFHHVGIGALVAAPCGNIPTSEFLFEPIIGNGHHWEYGVELSAHFRTWTHENQDEWTELFFNATISHLCNAKQKRSFDLKGKANSRYMLAQELSPIITQNLQGNGIMPNGQYIQHVCPVANITTFDINVSVNVQADIAFMYTYTKQKNTWSFGYSLFRRGCETIRIINPLQFPENRWALKGDAYLVGFIAEQLQPTDLPPGTAVNLSATQHAATINTGTNFPSKGISSDEATQKQQIINAQRNHTIDSPEQSTGGNNQYLVASMNDTSSKNSINTSIEPHYISFLDININSAATSGFSQKIFTHFNYSIDSQSSVTSYIGIGGEIEFGRHAGPTPAIGADACINCALSYWGTWIKGGINF